MNKLHNFSWCDSCFAQWRNSWGSSKQENCQGLFSNFDVCVVCVIHFTSWGHMSAWSVSTTFSDSPPGSDTIGKRCRGGGQKACLSQHGVPLAERKRQEAEAVQEAWHGPGCVDYWGWGSALGLSGPSSVKWVIVVLASKDGSENLWSSCLQNLEQSLAWKRQ